MGRTATGDACAKAILFGEHFVVYERPCIAVPLSGLRTHIELYERESAEAEPGPTIHSLVDGEGPRNAVLKTCELFGLTAETLVASVQSTVPLGCGLGSSASFAVALVRAAAQLTGAPLSSAEAAAQAYELEKLAHGTPSGVDNTTVAWERPLWFVRGRDPVVLPPLRQVVLIVADSGVRFSTATAVSGVRDVRDRDPESFDVMARQAADVARAGRQAMENADGPALGAAMRKNHSLLRSIGVCTASLDELVSAALRAGAWGAKLTGAGRGGSVIAACSASRSAVVCQALAEAGARAVVVASGAEPIAPSGAPLSEET